MQACAICLLLLGTCRQKTPDAAQFKVRCSLCTAPWCGNCLASRMGEDAHQVRGSAPLLCCGPCGNIMVWPDFVCGKQGKASHDMNSCLVIAGGKERQLGVPRLPLHLQLQLHQLCASQQGLATH